ncbi:DUF1684 domain-containing protein [Flavobacterium selenitireducens]|uniref:DUF1684 domain-containing protein n=1 Tax=Flavobacterium selenitireducens TaxID=2722704 RepID=UPI00168C053B|nr:DUF1684 domain-containing protein [Flavobacterium selenitireducens]MBD3581117.1 DUF1684 domain-containing protein [Flavobacterium selenitireducens]
MKFVPFCLLLIAFSGLAQPKFDIAAASDYQKQLNKEYADPTKSPLPEQDLKTFSGLDFYPVNEKFIVEAKFVKSQKQKPFGMKTTGDRRPMYVKYGELHFDLDGKSHQLNVYRNIELVKKEGYEDHLFLPFSDETSGKETYVGGRYIDMRVPLSDKIVIDFNRAYNPYCAYNYKYSCPIVPLENDLKAAIEAGVKKFHD